MRKLQRVLFILFLVQLAGLSACSEKHPDGRAPKFDEMAQVRERLKLKLGPKYDQPVPEATAVQLARGKKLYKTACATCHGDAGKPPAHMLVSLVKPPADLSNPAVANFYSEQARIEIIRNGIRGTPMKGWRGLLSEDDILAVFMYTRTLIKQ